jgi:DNA-binding sugar fermentation-stimulating protein
MIRICGSCREPQVAVVQVGVHSALANKCVAKMLEMHIIEGLQGYTKVTAEVNVHAYLRATSAAQQVLS